MNQSTIIKIMATFMLTFSVSRANSITNEILNIMELNKIDSQVTWGKAAESLNANFNHINSDMEKMKNASIRNKGYFSSESALKSTYSSACVGDIAYVGNVYPYQTWAWNGTEWEKKNDAGGEESVNLGNYYTKVESDAKFTETDTKLSGLSSELASKVGEVGEVISLSRSLTKGFIDVTGGIGDTAPLQQNEIYNGYKGLFPLEDGVMYSILGEGGTQESYRRTWTVIDSSNTIISRSKTGKCNDVIEGVDGHILVVNFNTSIPYDISKGIPLHNKILDLEGKQEAYLSERLPIRVDGIEKSIKDSASVVSLSTGMYDTSATVGSVATLSNNSTNTRYKSAIVSCQEGDVFSIKGKGVSAYRLWAFLGDGNVMLDRAVPNADTQGKYILLEAPVGATKFVYNTLIDGVEYELIKGRSVKASFDYTNARIDGLNSSISTINESSSNALKEAVSAKTIAETANKNAETANKNVEALSNVVNGSIEMKNLSPTLQSIIGAGGSGNGGSTFADGDDLEAFAQNGVSYIRLNSYKPYNPLEYSGYAHRIIRKNMVDGVNKLTSSPFDTDNTIYYIKYDFDLGGGMVTIRERKNIILWFEGGVIRNGGLRFLDCDGVKILFGEFVWYGDYTDASDISTCKNDCPCLQFYGSNSEASPTKNYCKNVEVAFCKINGNWTNQTGREDCSGIKLIACDGVFIHHNEIGGFRGDDIEIWRNTGSNLGSKNIRIFDNILNGSYRCNVALVNAENVMISRNVIRKSNTYVNSIDLEPNAQKNEDGSLKDNQIDFVKDIIIEGNIVDVTGEFVGISTQLSGGLTRNAGSGNVIVRNNQAKASRFFNYIGNEMCENVEVYGNEFVGDKFVTANNLVYLKVYNNNVNASDGVSFENCPYLSIYGNKFSSNNGNKAINLSIGCKGSRISSNECIGYNYGFTYSGASTLQGIVMVLNLFRTVNGMSVSNLEKYSIKDNTFDCSISDIIASEELINDIKNTNIIL